VVSGSETDVCVLASVLDAVDYGYRVIIVTNAVCSASDASHDALLELYRRRFDQQIETAQTSEIFDLWAPK
jgi:nicotinamidase-related amidase